MGPAIAIKTASVLTRPFDFRAIPPTLVKREAAPRRTRIWEFNTNLHCSIIGTCLSNAEIRQVLKKFGMASQDCSDHELHGIAVSLAGRHDDAARALHKALDHRHKLAVNQFARADTEDAVRAQWRDSVRRGDIPGAYWATLTHPLTNQAIIREAFGEVHMLSHLIGSANRADIRRLCQLESDKAALEEKLHRQQQALHDAVVTRDTQINELRQALADRIVTDTSAGTPADQTALHSLIADRERRLAVEIRRRTTLEDRLHAAQTERDAERAARIAAERTCATLRQELDAVEATFAAPPADSLSTRLDNVVLLYVGGRPNQVAPMRAMVENLGATFLHHDGGVENHQTLLPGLVSRCDFALFPVDCISHDAANATKSLCRQAGKRFIPLRSASVT
ncbi:MAG TPA: DUF2325 domain-containing protein, partial [Rhodopila sp.]|nr:DUF2325 domain-containing protein [Rhodopila sp.]